LSLTQKLGKRERYAKVSSDALVKSSTMPFSGIIMESNFYKACLRPMGASAPTGPVPRTGRCCVSG